ncbi:MAG: galactokinase, partial [Lachnospiraceae bacterium]|nr:galactokinase [Lachnospiraceae bacterium]
MKEKLLECFKEKYGYEEGVSFYFAPGRVNLIGEHTDYNGGHVFPCALSVGTYAAVAKRDDDRLRFYSINFPEKGMIEGSIKDLVYEEDARWTNYPKGVMWAFEGRGYKIPCGMDIVIYGDIPNGSGLSSSAALEVLTGFMLRDLFGFDLDNKEIALIGQYSENNFNGMNCGIMDQFASAMGKKDKAIFLDTATLEYEYAPVVLDGMKIIVTNSKVKHSLVDSAYNDRRSSCEKALEELK